MLKSLDAATRKNVEKARPKGVSVAGDEEGGLSSPADSDLIAAGSSSDLQEAAPRSPEEDGRPRSGLFAFKDEDSVITPTDEPKGKEKEIGELLPSHIS